jgi:hypothetical protein
MNLAIRNKFVRVYCSLESLSIADSVKCAGFTSMKYLLAFSPLGLVTHLALTLHLLSVWQGLFCLSKSLTILLHSQY